MNTEIETAVTGKPMTEYEPFVELVRICMANGLAMATEREFLEGLDQTVTLEQAFEDYARSFIKWRGAFIIERMAGESR